jgi:hypothetical protein
MKAAKVPASSVNSAAPNKGKVVKAYKSTGIDSRVRPGETTGANAGATVHSQMQPAPGAHPVRVRHAEPVKSGNTLAHVTDGPETKPRQTREEAEANKMKLFVRGGSGNSDAVPHPSTSPRDWNEAE